MATAATTVHEIVFFFFSFLLHASLIHVIEFYGQECGWEAQETPLLHY